MAEAGIEYSIVHIPGKGRTGDIDIVGRVGFNKSLKDGLRDSKDVIQADEILEQDDPRFKNDQTNGQEGDKNNKEGKDSFTEDAAEFATGAAFAAGADFVADHLKDRKEENKSKEENSTVSFVDIQSELRTFVDNPNPQRERELKKQRAKLVREAKDVGVFETVKGHMEKVQAVSSFDEAEKTIKRINIENVENEAEGLAGWSKNYEGMIGEYVEVAILNMDLALAEEGGGSYRSEAARTESINRLRREIDIRGWGMPPPNLNRLAREFLNPVVVPQSVGDREREEMNRKIDELERQLRATLSSPGAGFDAETFARAMGVADPTLQRAMYVRAEMKMFPIPAMDLDVPRFLIQTGHGVDIIEQQERWKARSRLSNAAAHKRMAPSYDKVFPNQDLIDLSKDNFETLLRIEGVVEAASLYTAMLVEKGINPNDLLDAPGLKDSIFSIRSEGDFDDIRLAVRGWCKNNLSLNIDEAAEAEQIAWNTIYVSGMVEEYDSRFKHPEVQGRVPPIIGTFKSLPFWMLMHPQERLEAKVRAKEAWSRAGEWALNRSRLFKVPVVLPTEVAHNSLNEINLENTRTGKKESLFAILKENGQELIRSGNIVRSGEDLNIESLSEGPFGGYCFDTISPSITILSLIDKGMQKDTAITKVGDAFRKLNISNKDRENILIVAHGLNPKSLSLKPSMGRKAWNNLKSGFKRYAPNLFKN